MIRLSIIMAAYNVENYVRACLESVLKAAPAQCELVIVLGKSKDRTNEICMSYAKKTHLHDTGCGGSKAGTADSRTQERAAKGKYVMQERAAEVRCIMQDGCGLSNARNCGIRAAQGEYVTFMDADDSVDGKDFAGFCLFLEGVCRKRGFDMLVNDFYSADAEGRVLLESRQIAASKGCVFGASYAVRLVRSRGTFWNAWRYVYRRGYLLEKGRRFAEGRTCEDLDFAVRSMLDGPDAVFCHMPYYKYCPLRPGSLMHVKNLSMVDDFLKTAGELLRETGARRRQEPAAAMAEKLKELMILTLPDLFELSKWDRKQAARQYRKLFSETSLPEHALRRAVFVLCRTRFLKTAGFVLWLMRRARRKIRYRSRARNFGASGMKSKSGIKKIRREHRMKRGGR